jgi:hypothetical protein
METSKLEWTNKSKRICVYFVSVFAFVNGSAALFALLFTMHTFPNLQLFRARTYMHVTLVSTFQTVHALQLCVCDGHKNKRKARTVPMTNTAERSPNHCCRGKAINIKYYEYVSTALVIQHAKNMRHFILSSVASLGARGGVVVKALRYKPADRGFDSRWCQWNFPVTYSCRSHYGPGLDSVSNRNEYQVYFLGVKVAGA